MKVTMFSKRFAPLVEVGTKRQTIRPRPKRPQDMPKVGEMRSLREWTGKPYRSKQRELRQVKVTAVFPIELRDRTLMHLNGFGLKPTDDWAQADGFKDWQDMHDWFHREHGLPFSGILFSWEKSKERKGR